MRYVVSDAIDVLKLSDKCNSVNIIYSVNRKIDSSCDWTNDRCMNILSTNVNCDEVNMCYRISLYWFIKIMAGEVIVDFGRFGLI